MKTRLMSYAMAATMALGLFCLGPNPAAAEDELGVHSTVSYWGPLRYHAYQYPSKSTGFFFFPKSYVTFDVVNGKYFELESNRADYEMHHDAFWNWGQVFPFGAKQKALRPEQVTLTFYTPDMKVLGVFEDFKPNHRYSIPRDGNDYERIVCRIQMDGEQNWDMKLRVWDPIDPVMAEPTGGARWRP